jgi:hypothetical protein
MKHGKGKYIWNDGSQYDGEWEENQINGKVVYCLNNIDIGCLHLA